MTSENVTPRLPLADKRRHPRHPVELQMDLWHTPDAVFGGFVTDMTEVGLGFRSTHRIQVSAGLGIRVYLSREESRVDFIEGTGRIIWRSAHREEDWKGYRYGMYILKMAPYSRERLMKYIQMLEEEESSSDQKRAQDRS